jgi:hypothetical protein
VEALSHAILDKHCNAVPAGVLIRILGDVVVPVVQFLGEVLVQAAQAEKLDAPRRIQQQQQQQHQQGSTQSQLPPRWKTTGTSSSLVSPTVKPPPHSQAHLNPRQQSQQQVPQLVAPVAVVVPKVAFVDEALNGLCTAFVNQLNKLAAYPSFDKLWFRFLHVFGYFLGAAHSFDESLLLVSPEDTGAYRQRELQSAVELAREKAQVLIDCLVRTKIFKRRPELWMVTVDIVSQFKFCPNLTDCAPTTPISSPQGTVSYNAGDSSPSPALPSLDIDSSYSGTPAILSVPATPYNTPAAATPGSDSVASS